MHILRICCKLYICFREKLSKTFQEKDFVIYCNKSSALSIIFCYSRYFSSFLCTLPVLRFLVRYPGQSRSSTPSTLPCTTSFSKLSLFLLLMCPQYFNMHLYTGLDNWSLMFNSSSCSASCLKNFRITFQRSQINFFQSSHFCAISCNMMF